MSVGLMDLVLVTSHFSPAEVNLDCNDELSVNLKICFFGKSRFWIFW